MRSEPTTRWFALALALGGCSYEWDALRPRADGGALTTDVGARPDVLDASADVVTDAGAGAASDGAPTDAMVDGGARDAVAMDVAVDVAVDVVAVDVVAADVPMDVVVDTGARDSGPMDVGTPDTGPRDTGVIDIGPLPCNGPQCPCAPSTPAGWCAIGATCTSGACASGPVAGALVITEIMNDPDVVTDAVGEWFEVYNRMDTPVDVRGLRVRGNGTEAFEVSGSSPIVVAGRGYAVLGISADPIVNGGVTVLYPYGSAMALSNSSTDTLTLLASDNTTVIDAVTYGTTVSSGWPVTPGRAKSLRPAILDATLNDLPASWCAAGVPFGRGDDGTPGAASVCQ